MAENDYSLATKLLHNRAKTDPHTGATSVPVYQASTFHQKDVHQFGPFDYSRSGNPTRQALEEVIADLEGGARGFAFSSGMAAISSALMLLSGGDHVVVSADVYGGTYRVITDVLARFGIAHTFVDTSDSAAVEKAMRPETKVLYVETPSNPLLKTTDVRQMAEICRRHGCLLFVDNTFLTPALKRPLEEGADVVLHSATKFLAGHSDVVAGLAVTRDAQLGERLAFLQNAVGAILSPHDAWLVLRGLKTLGVRMRQSEATARRLVPWLAKHPAVQRVYYPEKEGGAVLSFELAGEEAVAHVVKRMRLPVFSVSLGAVETILSYPAKMSHASMPEAERERRGIRTGLLRLSVGLEDEKDLICDLEHALAGVPTAVGAGR